MLIEGRTATNPSVFVAGGTNANATVATSVDVTKKVSASVFALGKVFADRKIKGTVSLNKRYQNNYYGIQEPQSASFLLGNEDQGLNFLLAETAKGSPIRVRRIDEVTKEFMTVFEGTINDEQIGDDIELSANDIDLTLFDVNFPKYRIYGRNAIPPVGLSELDLQVNFKDAIDVNAAIPIIFGRVPYLPLSLIKEDSVSKKYDYIVAEGMVDVEETYEVGANGPVPKFSVSGSCQTATSTTITLDPLDSGGFFTDLDTGEYYQYLWIVMTSGLAVDQERQIISYDKLTKIATLDSAWGTIPTAGDSYKIKQFTTLKGTDYPGRTVVRFSSPNRTEGSLQSIYARAVRYVEQKKNLLQYTSSLSKWERGSTLLSLGGPGKIQESIEDQQGGNRACRVSFNNNNEQRVALVGTATGSFTNSIFTISFWAKGTNTSNSPTITTWVINPSGGYVYYGSTPFALTTDWQKITITLPADPSLESTIKFALSFGSAGGGVQSYPIDVFAPQIELGNTATWYEPKNAEGQSEAFTPIDALKYVLKDPVCLNQPLNEGTFQKAIDDVGPYYLYFEGSVPTLDGQEFAAKDLIDKITSMRGIRLVKQGSSWSVYVDKARNPVGTFGTGDTIFKNVKQLGKIHPPSSSDLIKTLKLNYGTSFRGKSSTPDNRYQQSFSNNIKIGVDLEEDHEFIQQHVSASAYIQYKVNRNNFGSSILSCTLGHAAALLNPGDLLNFYVPRRQVENKLLYSEDFTTAAWVGTTTNITPRIAIDPEGKGYSANKIIAGGVTQTISGSYKNRYLYGSVWVRSDTANGGTVQVTLGTGSSVVKTWPCGMGWSKVELERYSNDTSPPYLRIDNVSNGATLFIWGAQLGADYKRPYVRTTSVGIDPQDQWTVLSISQNGLEDFSVELAPYNPSIYSISALTAPITTSDGNTYNPRFVPPPLATNLSVPPAPPTPTAAAGVVGSTGEGIVNSWADVQFVMPTENCTRVVIQRRIKDNSSSTQTRLWEDCATATVQEFGLNSLAKVRVNNFTAGQPYELRTVSYNSAGLSTSNDSTAVTFIPRGDETAPPSATTISAVQGTGRSIDITVGLPTYSYDLNAGGTVTTITKPIDDLAYVQLYRYAVVAGGAAPTNGASGSLLDRALKSKFHDINGVTVGYDYYYWARTEDYTGNVSGYYPSGVGVKAGATSSVVNADMSGPIIISAGSTAGISNLTLLDSTTGAEISFYNMNMTTKYYSLDFSSTGFRILPGNDLSRSFYLGENGARFDEFGIRAQTLHFRSADVQSGNNNGIINSAPLNPPTGSFTPTPSYWMKAMIGTTRTWIPLYI